MAKRKGGVPLKSQGKTSVKNMPSVPNTPRMSVRSKK